MEKVGVNRGPESRDKKPVALREKGSALIPYTRFDYAYQKSSDIHSSDYRLEGGFGAIGAQIRKTAFVEQHPNDKLDLLYVHGLYRMSFGSTVEIDIGLGQLTIEGDNKNNGTSFTLPVLIHPTDTFGLEFRPTWSTIHGNTIRDIDIAALYGINHVSVKAGYRNVTAGGTSIKGPYIGVSVRY